MRIAAGLVAALAVAGCGSAPQAPVTVADILAHCDAYKGKTVRAVGYLGQCQQHGCFLAAHRAAYKAFVTRWMDREYVERSTVADPAAVEAAQKRLETFEPLTLPDDPAWLLKAAPFEASMVVVTGTVAKDKCTKVSHEDYSASFQATDIRAATPADGAPDGAPRGGA